MRRRRTALRARLLGLCAALAVALAIGPVAARAQAYAAAALGADLCTTPDGKAPASGGAHADHSHCCMGAAFGPPPAPVPAFVLQADAARTAPSVDAVRVARIVAARPRGPPALG